jgi:hypothetical protein
MWHGRNVVRMFNKLKLTGGVTLRLRVPRSNMLIGYSVQFMYWRQFEFGPILYTMQPYGILKTFWSLPH